MFAQGLLWANTWISRPNRLPQQTRHQVPCAGKIEAPSTADLEARSRTFHPWREPRYRGQAHPRLMERGRLESGVVVSGLGRGSPNRQKAGRRTPSSSRSTYNCKFLSRPLAGWDPRSLCSRTQWRIRRSTRRQGKKLVRSYIKENSL